MDKAILHSVLESSALVGTEVDIKFTSGFDQYSGHYRIDVNKMGRGRGGSRVIEATNLATGAVMQVLPGTRNSSNTGERLLGTAVSEYIESFTVGGITYDEGKTESATGTRRRKNARPETTTTATAPTEATPPTSKQPKQKRETKRQATTSARASRTIEIGKKVASILGPLCQENPGLKLKLATKTGDFTGEWSVAEFTYENDRLLMTLHGLTNKSTFQFDTAVHAEQLTDASMIEVD
jgi:hypothetical protein